MRLSERPDLLHLVVAYDAAYRGRSSGGSASIRGHLQRVREAMYAVLGSDPEVVDRLPATLPVTAHLGAAQVAGERGPVADLADALAPVTGLLTWEYGYPRVPDDLAVGYGYCEVVGPRGPVVVDDVILGLVLLAPGVTYPRHRHEGIEESYLAVAGAWSQNDAGVHAPGSLIVNPPGAEHRITTGSTDPVLLTYAWLGPATRLRDPGMRLDSGVS